MKQNWLTYCFLKWSLKSVLRIFTVIHCDGGAENALFLLLANDFAAAALVLTAFAETLDGVVGDLGGTLERFPASFDVVSSSFDLPKKTLLK